MKARGQGSGGPVPAEIQPALDAVQALRERGAHQWDPVRFRYLEVLARRLPAAPGPVRRILAGKLLQALDAFPLPLAPAPLRPRPPAPACPELAGLRSYLDSARQRLNTAGDGAADAPWNDPPGATHELAGARRFRHTWSRFAAQAQVARAVERGPDNAGPLNSHQLMLRTLALMRELSPDYLRRFMAQADALLWLEQAQGRPRPVAATAKVRGPRAGPKKKAGV